MGNYWIEKEAKDEILNSIKEKLEEVLNKYLFESADQKTLKSMKEDVKKVISLFPLSHKYEITFPIDKNSENILYARITFPNSFGVDIEYENY